MATVGIIANPASGKDIRRLVAHGSVFDNYEKVNMTRRLLLGLQAVGAAKVLVMPDHFGIGTKARASPDVSVEMTFLDMIPRGNAEDSSRAARLLREAGVGCIVTLGGDGTNRAVAKESGSVPLMPLSTGTNNVFPYMVEATLAGMVAGLVAQGRLSAQATTLPTKRLEVEVDGQPADIALIDAAVCTHRFLGARALWQMEAIESIFLTRAEPQGIGLSAIGGYLHPVGAHEPRGLYLRLGPGGTRVLAPIAPGLFAEVGVQSYQPLALGEGYLVTSRRGTLALDGERELQIAPGQQMVIRLTQNGPRLVDFQGALHQAAQQGLLQRQETIKK